MKPLFGLKMKSRDLLLLKKERESLSDFRPKRSSTRRTRAPLFLFFFFAALSLFLFFQGLVKNNPIKQRNQAPAESQRHKTEREKVNTEEEEEFERTRE